MNNAGGVGHSISCAGTADFIGGFGIDLAEVLEDAFGEEARGLDDVPDVSLLGAELGPRADLATSMLVGFVMFLSSWMAKTFLDEVYQLKPQPRVRSWLVAADERARGGWRGRQKTFTVSAWYEDLGVIVIIALQASTFTRIAEESEGILAAAWPAPSPSESKGSGGTAGASRRGAFSRPLSPIPRSR